LDGVMTIASFVIACLSALGTCIAIWYSRGQKHAADKSATEAKRSADATAEAVEIERERRVEELAEADRGRVNFQLVPQGQHAYLLCNKGSGIAYGVHVDVQDVRTINDVELVFDFEEFRDGESQPFNLFKILGSPGDIRVTWYQLSDCTDAQRSKKINVA
jgi:hypothetical protein